MAPKDKIQDLSFKNNKFAYFLAYVSFGIVNPTFQQYEFFPILLLAFLTFLFFFRKQSFDKLFYLVVFSLFILLIGQAVTFGHFTFRSFAGRYLIWLIPYFIIRHVQIKYFRLFVNTLYVFSIIGLFFWVIVNLSPGIYNFLLNLVKSLGTDPISGESFIIYNLDHHRPGDLFFMKNPGPFNEGGMYACYLILALVINTFHTNKLWEKKNIIFAISILTTTSTAAYIAFFLLILVYYFSKQNLSSRLIILPVALILSYYAYTGLPFLSDKITKQFEEQSEMEMGERPRVGRFYSAKVGIELIKQNPLTGIGLYREDRFLSKEEEEIGITGSTNGVIDFATKYGLVFWFFYFSAMYLSLKKYAVYNSFQPPYIILFLLPLLATGSAQDPFNSPVYIILAYQYFYLKVPVKESKNGKKYLSGLRAPKIEYL